MTQTLVNTEAISSADVAKLVAQGLRHASVRHFHAHWYHQKTTWAMTRYRGVPTLKCPMDLQIYHEMIWSLRPQVIVETGTCFGGSALWFADQLEMVHGPTGYRVISVDITDQRTAPEGLAHPWPAPDHPAITWIVGDSSDAEVVATVTRLATQLPGPCMASLDSDHTQAHVAKELAAYAPLVTPGQYLVVEDTNISGRPLTCPTDAGPGAAVDAFLVEHPEFVPDLLCERYLLTMHPKGWLRRKADG